ncbi:MAG TPA: DinB family protein [Terriglobales bacterium]|nr:DinB family protein [Terriglobales bacterium]
MSEISRISQQLKLAYEGEAWHGPAVLEILSGVDARAAAARPIPNAHTIWELTLHISGWEDVIRRRLGGEACTLGDADNFPDVKDKSEAAWNKTVEALKLANQELLKAMNGLPDSRLTDRVPGKNYDVYTMLHGAVQHALYHAGQIAILKRASE